MRIIADKYTDRDRVRLERTVFDALHVLYGHTVLFDGNDRTTPYSYVEQEWELFSREGRWKEVLLLKRITDWLKRNDSPYWIPGYGASGVLLYLLGITEGNPLPPHYHPKGGTDLLWATDMADGFDRAHTFEGEDDTDGCGYSELSGVPRTAWARRQPHVCDGHGLRWSIQKIEYNNTEYELTVCCNPENERGLREAFADHKVIEDIDWIPASLNERPGLTVNIVFEEDVPLRDKGFFQQTVTSENWREILRVSGLSVENFLDRCFAFEDGTEHANDLRELIGYFSDEMLFSDMISFGGLCCEGVYNATAKTLVRELGYPVHAMIAFRDDIFSWLSSVKPLDFDEGDGPFFKLLLEMEPYEKRELYLDGLWTSQKIVLLSGDREPLSPYCTNLIALPAKGIEPWIVKQYREIPYFPSKAQAVERILFELKLLASAQSGQEDES